MKLSSHSLRSDLMQDCVGNHAQQVSHIQGTSHMPFRMQNVVACWLVALALAVCHATVAGGTGPVGWQS